MKGDTIKLNTSCRFTSVKTKRIIPFSDKKCDSECLFHAASNFILMRNRKSNDKNDMVAIIFKCGTEKKILRR
jgi:hypothetical protein